MSISSEITRISNAKTAIAESITNKGVTVPSGTKIDGMATLIDSIPTGGGGGDTSETWVLNENPTVNRNTFVDVQIQFVSNGQTFSRINIARVEVNGINYDDVWVYNAIGDETIGAHWVLENYRKVTFATAPTGDLLTWLQSNAVKQASDTAVQPSKAITVTSNGTTTITADTPYDAIKQVDLTVNVSGGGSIDYNTIATTWAKYDCNFENNEDKTISVANNVTGLGAVLSPNGQDFAVFTFGVPPASTATSLSLGGYIWCFTLSDGEVSALNTGTGYGSDFITDNYIYLQVA